MADYINGKWNNVNGKHMVARSSKIKATDAGHLYDLIDKTNDVEQGMNIKVGDHTGDGYQERVALTPSAKDQIVFVCDTALIYEDNKKSDQLEWKYVNVAGKDFRAYEIVKDDIFGVSDYGFSVVADETEPCKFGNYVVVDGARKYKELAEKPLETEYGFIGRIVGYEKYQFDTIVLIETIQNVQL